MKMQLNLAFYYFKGNFILNVPLPFQRGWHLLTSATLGIFTMGKPDEGTLTIWNVV